jgi:hypothetical protein
MFSPYLDLMPMHAWHLNLESGRPYSKVKHGLGLLTQVESNRGWEIGAYEARRQIGETNVVDNGNHDAIMGDTEIGIKTLLLAGFDNIISMSIKVKYVLTSMGTAGL